MHWLVDDDLNIIKLYYIFDFLKLSLMTKELITKIIIVILLIVNINVFYFIFRNNAIKNFSSNDNLIASLIDAESYFSTVSSNFTNYQKLSLDKQKEDNENNLSNKKYLANNKTRYNTNQEQSLDSGLFYFEEIRKNLLINKQSSNFLQNNQSLNANIDFINQSQFFNKANNPSAEITNLQFSSSSVKAINILSSSVIINSSSDNNFQNNYYNYAFLKATISAQDDKKNDNIVSSLSHKNDICEAYKSKNYPKILISEIKFEAKDNPDDEYIELYNPTDIEIDLTCWSLEKYASKQDSNSLPNVTILLPASKFNGVIRPYSFFLITSSSTKEKYKGDLAYAQSYSLAKNNTIILKKPNGEVVDLIGYGDNKEKIYQYEANPFLSQNFYNKSIQRKNLQDSGNNSEDFWLKDPNPENSTFPIRKPREDFIDLSKINLGQLQVFIITNEEKTLLKLVLNSQPSNIFSSNYVYNLLIATSANIMRIGENQLNTTMNVSTNGDLLDKNISVYSHLEDFGSTSSLLLSKFDFSTTAFETIITKCPSTSTLYYFAIYLQDLLDKENRTSFAIASTTLPEHLCNPEAEEKITFTSTTTSATATVKILISEVRVIEGTSTNEYIELYNPNNTPINLAGWKLLKYNSENKASTIISDRTKSKFKDITLQPFSYLLLANTSTLLINGKNINVDLIYALSNDLAKNNSLALVNDKDVIVDQFSWDRASDHKSYSRKKIDVTSEDNYFTDFTDLGNAYDTNNISDFILVDPNPQNSSISKPIPLDIIMSNYELENNNSEALLNIILSWITPFVYDNANYEYRLFFATSADNFYSLDGKASFVLPQFQALSLQKVKITNLNINSLISGDSFDIAELKLKLELYKNNNKISEIIYRKN